MPRCTFCHTEVPIDDKVFRTDTCPHCERDLHCCLNCIFYEEGRQNDCREERAERVVEKDRANFCDYFHFGAAVRAQDPVAKAKADLAALFKF